MTMTLLEIVTEALDNINSLNVPSFLFTNTDDTARQAIAIAKKVGRELARDHDFQQLQHTHTITTSDGTSSYALPTDYDRFVFNTAWDATTYRQMSGNASPQSWAGLVNNQVGVSTVHFFRLRNDLIHIYPTPSSVWTGEIDYYSKNYCAASDGTEQSAWLNDTDYPLLPEDLFIAGVEFYFRKANNLPYADAEAEYSSIIARREVTNVPSGILNLSEGIYLGNIPYNIPDGVPTT